MNEESHWNGIAHRYEDEIFDVFRSDKFGRLRDCFSRYANPRHDAIDFGCGVGKAFRFLSPTFRHVIATDISGGCLKQARALAATAAYDNISFRRADMSRQGLRFEPVHFAFCCNVIMLPEPEKNRSMFRNMHRSLKKQGTAVMVLPSLDSILLATLRLMQWYAKEGVKPAEVPASELQYYSGHKRDLIQGIVKIDNVPTKHYTATELEVLLGDAGFSNVTIGKIEYDWNTEFSEPPSWLKAPYPWDWLVEAKS